PPAVEATAATEAIAAIADIPQPVTLTARITQEGSVIPDGVVWRVFDSAPDASGEMALVAKSDSGAAQLELPPGDYVVHLPYGQAQASETLSVGAGGITHEMVLDAGALRLNSAVTGDIPISPALLHFDIFTAGPENERSLIADDLPPN